MSLEQSLAAKMVWSFVARADEVDLDDDPQKVVARTVYNLAAGKYSGGLVGVAAECRVPWPVDDAVLDAAAWAGQARWALIQRDRAIRSAVAQGASARSVAAAVGMSRPGVERVLARENRW
jgi:hypothetical protein